MPSNQLEAILLCGWGCGNETCCPDRPCPGDGVINPFPSTLSIEITASFPYPPTVTPSGSGFSPPAPSDCFNMAFTLNLSECTDIQRVYAGVGEKTCTWCSQTFTMRVSVLLVCSTGSGWLLTFEDLADPGDCAVPSEYSINFDQVSCDPVLLTGDLDTCIECSSMQCQIGAIEISPGVIVPVIATHELFCLSVLISEDP